MGLGKDPEADGAEVLLDMVSGSNVPDPITLNATRYIWLRFLTDFANERSGWSLEIATIPTSSKLSKSIHAYLISVPHHCRFYTMKELNRTIYPIVP